MGRIKPVFMFNFYVNNAVTNSIIAEVTIAHELIAILCIIIIICYYKFYATTMINIMIIVHKIAISTLIATPNELRKEQLLIVTY